ncbi:MAG TPA: helix-turn-helix domain-containing protein [Solimonas sp.]
MGRPAKPLISRDRAARAALGAIDIHGLEALSLELVAQRLGVKAPSLYYHFKHKAELLAEVARLILMDAKIPKDFSSNWKEAMLALNVAVRRSILQHPNAAPLLLQFFPRHLLLGAYDHWIGICTLPMEQRMVLVDGLEKLTFGSALFEAAYRSRGIEPMPQFDRNRLPQLSEALRANHLDGEALFIATVRQYLDGFASVAPKAPADRAKAKAKKPAVKAPAKKVTVRKRVAAR